MFTRVVMIGVASAALAVGTITGCSSTNSTNSSSPSGSTAGSLSSGATTVLVDGQTHNVSGGVTCTAAGTDTNVAIGDPITGVGAVVSNDSSAAVHSVGLGTVNGVTLGYSDATTGPGNATATKTGSNSYKITGTAVGLDSANQQQVSKSFEMDFSCP
jgi:lipoprotein LpqH